jgi:hypothetical protein
VNSEQQGRPVRVRVIGDLFHGRVPPGAVYVGRGAPGLVASPYANPHRVGSCRRCGVTHDRASAVAAYARDLTTNPTRMASVRRDLGGWDLACWCRLEVGPCHADVLLALANPDLVDGGDAVIQSPVHGTAGAQRRSSDDSCSPRGWMTPDLAQGSRQTGADAVVSRGPAGGLGAVVHGEGEEFVRTPAVLTQQDSSLTLLAARLLDRSAQVVPLRLRGVSVDAVVDINLHEHQRRQRASVGAVGDRDVLTALLPLDPGVTVPHAVLSAGQQRAVRRAGAGLVVAERRRVTRLVQVPATVSLVLVRDVQWARGIQRAARFGPYCERVLVLPRVPADLDGLLLEATYYGVGVATLDEPEVVSRAVFTPMRFTVSSWMFAEAAYGQFLDQMFRTFGNGTGVETSPAR